MLQGNRLGDRFISESNLYTGIKGVYLADVKMTSLTTERMDVELKAAGSSARH